MKPTIEAIEAFLRAVDQDFPVPLSQKQELHQYAKKLQERATVCAVCAEGTILSMVAGYIDHVERNMGYISIAATEKGSRGKGYGSMLVRQFLEAAGARGLDSVHLYAVASNVPAVRMYRALGFRDYHPADEPRPDDLHLIYHIKEWTA